MACRREEERRGERREQKGREEKRGEGKGWEREEQNRREEKAERMGYLFLEAGEPHSAALIFDDCQRANSRSVCEREDETMGHSDEGEGRGKAEGRKEED